MTSFVRARTPRHLRSAVRVTLAVALLALLAACSEPEPYKPTFFGRTEGVREPVAQPEGLNPLGAIGTCGDPPQLEPGEERVIVARPDLFTREASIMISSLRQAISDGYHGQRPVRFLLTGRFVQTNAQAVAEGQRCSALIVLWEVYATRALELTIPDPARIPLRYQFHQRLCEFGSYTEQLQILYLTIQGLLAMRDNDYETANVSLETAMRIDSRCLQLPKAPDSQQPSDPPRSTAAPNSAFRADTDPRAPK
jgi:hypothetical protein